MDQIDAQIEGARVEIGFNNRYFLDALHAKLRKPSPWNICTLIAGTPGRFFRLWQLRRHPAAFFPAACIFHTDEVRIALNGALSPMKILPLEGESFLFLVLPVRLKSE